MHVRNIVGRSQKQTVSADILEYSHEGLNVTGGAVAVRKFAFDLPKAVRSGCRDIDLVGKTEGRFIVEEFVIRLADDLVGREAEDFGERLVAQQIPEIVTGTP